MRDLHLRLVGVVVVVVLYHAVTVCQTHLLPPLTRAFTQGLMDLSLYRCHQATQTEYRHCCVYSITGSTSSSVKFVQQNFFLGVYFVDLVTCVVRVAFKLAFIQFLLPLKFE